MEPTIARIDMAMAHANKGDLDHACQLTRQAAAIPADLRTGPIMARVQEFFAGLEPRHRGLPAVQGPRAPCPPSAHADRWRMSPHAHGWRREGPTR